MIRQIYRDCEGEADGADRLGKPFSPASENLFCSSVPRLLSSCPALPIVASSTAVTRSVAPSSTPARSMYSFFQASFVNLGSSLNQITNLR